MNEGIGTFPETFTPSQDFMSFAGGSWESFGGDLEIFFDTIFISHNFFTPEKRDQITSDVITYLESKNISINDIDGIDVDHETIIIVYYKGNSLTTENIEFSEYINIEKEKEKAQVEIISKTGEFELVLDAIQAVFQDNEEEWFKYIEEDDILNNNGTLKGKSVFELCGLAREKWKDILESLIQLGGEAPSDTLTKIQTTQERYLRMSMGVGSMYHRGIHAFKRSQDEVNYMIESHLNTLGTPGDVIAYFAEIQTELEKNRNSSSFKAYEGQIIFVKALQGFTYSRLQELNASQGDYGAFAQLLTGREDEIAGIRYIHASDIEDLDLRDRNPQDLKESVIKKIELKFTDFTNKDSINGINIISQLTGYDDSIFSSSDISTLTPNQKRFLISLMELEGAINDLIDIGGSKSKIPVKFFWIMYSRLNFHNTEVHRDFYDADFATQILSEQLGKTNGLFDTLYKDEMLTIIDPAIGDRSPQSIIDTTISLIGEVVSDENGEPVSGHEILSSIPGYDDIMCVPRNNYQTLSIEQKIWISSIIRLERSLKIEQTRLRVNDIRYRDNPNDKKITLEQFSSAYQNSIISGSKAVIKGINDNFDMSFSGGEYLTRETLEKTGKFSDETLDLLELYNDINGNGDFWERSDSFQSGLRFLGNIGLTIVGGIALTMLTGGTAAILGAGIRIGSVTQKAYRINRTGRAVQSAGNALLHSGSRAQMIGVGVNASIASWGIYPEGHDSFSEMLTNRGTDVIVGGVTANVGYVATKRFAYEGAKFLSRGDLVNRGIQAGDITANGIAPEVARQLAVRAIFAGEDIFDDKDLLKTELTPSE